MIRIFCQKKSILPHICMNMKVYIFFFFIFLHICIFYSKYGCMGLFLAYGNIYIVVPTNDNLKMVVGVDNRH